MKRVKKLTENDLKRIIKKLISETEEINLSRYRQYLPLLQQINRNINMIDVIKWFNQNNVNYIGLNDLEMIIIYIARNS